MKEGEGDLDGSVANAINNTFLLTLLQNISLARMRVHKVDQDGLFVHYIPRIMRFRG